MCRIIKIIFKEDFFSFTYTQWALGYHLVKLQWTLHAFLDRFYKTTSKTSDVDDVI